MATKDFLYQQNDASLWNEIRIGNKQALGILYGRYFDSLFSYGLMYTKKTETVEDCIQDLFISIFENKSIKPVCYVQAYLLRSLRNRILADINNNITEELKEQAFDLAIEEDVLQHIFPHDDESLYLSKKMMNGFRSLNENQKNILYLRYVKELSYNEIAEILDINPQSAQNTLSRTLIKLRDIVKKI